MLKAKGNSISKPSKASLKSRGLSSNAVSQSHTPRRQWCGRPISKAASVDGCYSLYSTDSEDNVTGVNKGLDKCAELLTNILEFNSEKVIQKQQHSHNRSQSVGQKSRKPRSNANSKADTTKAAKLNKQKTRNNSIHKPSTQNNQHSSRCNPAYIERLVSSTPVFTAQQRKRQLELQLKENVLQQQIELLQTQYENLQKRDDQSVPDSDPDTVLPQLLNINEEQAGERNRPVQGTRSTRKSLDFTTDAEKPFIDSGKERRPSGVVSSSGSPSLGNNDNEEDEAAGKAAARVQFAKQNLHEAHETDGETASKSKLERGEPGRHNSPCATSRLDGHGSENIPVGGTERNQFRMNLLKYRSPERNIDHLKILTYLIGELKAVLGNSEDVEVERLLMEIENEVRLLSYPKQSLVTSPVAGIHGRQHDIDTEVALQPLRSENSDLRRKLRITNQRLREMEYQCRQMPEKSRLDSLNEGLVENLHYQLLEERQNAGKLRLENELTEKKLSEYMKEKQNTQVVLSEKEKEIEMLNEEMKRQKERELAVTSQMKLQLESNTISLGAKDKELSLLNLALEQRDTEIERLTELTRGLQQSLTKVLTNVQGLHPDDVISDVSSLHSLLDSWQPSKLTTADLSRAPQRGQGDHMELLNNCEGEYEQAREYSENNLDSYGQNVYSRNPPDPESQDNMSSFSSSGEESTFKQELANLDTAIVRLQNNLRDKL